MSETEGKTPGIGDRKFTEGDEVVLSRVSGAYKNTKAYVKSNLPGRHVELHNNFGPLGTYHEDDLEMHESAKDKINKMYDKSGLNTLKEEAVNTAGGGAIAGIGVGADGEPGVNKKNAKYRAVAVLMGMIRRKLKNATS